MKRYYKENKKTGQKPREDIGIHTKIDIQIYKNISEKIKKKANKIYKFCYIYIFLYLLVCYIY